MIFDGKMILLAENLFYFIFQANMWLGTLLIERSEDIYRMKGLLSVDGMNERFVFQVIEFFKALRLALFVI